MVDSILNFVRRNFEAGIVVISLTFLVFVAGAAVDFFRIFPYETLQHGFLAADAFRERYLTEQPTFERAIWYPARHKGRGITLNNGQAAFPGFTLYASGDAQRAYLIDLNGEVVHLWELAFRDVWPQPSHVGYVVPSQNIYYRRVRAFPNGDLLVVLEGAGSTPYGYGLFKIDKDSNIIWRYSEPAHHDIDVAADGTIYALIHYNRTSLPDDGQFRNIETPFIDDYVVVLSRDGKELDRVKITQAILNSPYDYLLRGGTESPDDKRDPLHNNTIKVLSEKLAPAHPYGKPGQVLLSMKALHLIALLDIELRQIVWAARGAWRAQHDPRFLENGNILVFDNKGHFGSGGRSQILEFDPQTLSIDWSYAGTEEWQFSSLGRGMQQRLRNGNTLITETQAGRLFEVLSGGEIVWEYIVPVRGGEDGELIPLLTSGWRYSREELPFLDTL